MSNQQINIKHLAQLSSLNLSDAEAKELTSQLESTLDTISTLDELNTKGTEPTSQVTGLVNVYRQDEIDQSRVLTQDQALKHADQTHDGYFVVPQLIDS